MRLLGPLTFSMLLGRAFDKQRGWHQVCCSHTYLRWRVCWLSWLVIPCNSIATRLIQTSSVDWRKRCVVAMFSWPLEISVKRVVKSLSSREIFGLINIDGVRLLMWESEHFLSTQFFNNWLSGRHPALSILNLFKFFRAFRLRVTMRATWLVMTLAIGSHYVDWLLVQSVR